MAKTDYERMVEIFERAHVKIEEKGSEYSFAIQAEIDDDLDDYTDGCCAGEECECDGTGGATPEAQITFQFDGLGQFDDVDISIVTAD